jgi:hypothetical protein
MPDARRPEYARSVVSPEVPDSFADKTALNESLLRERNEALETHNASVHWVDPPVADWYCECAQIDCDVPVQLTVEEYERVRANPRWFIVAPDERHRRPDVERLVEQTDRYWVVEKVGEAAEMAEALDPRS